MTTKIKLNIWLLKYKNTIIRQVFENDLDNQVKCAEEIMVLEKEWRDILDEFQEQEVKV